MNDGPQRGEQPEDEPVVIRDNRRISADGSAQVSPAASGSAPHPKVESGQSPDLDAVEELTRDLQRVTAEYANYRKRVDRDRALIAEQATGVVVAALLPILDDLDRARDHGDLEGPFGAMAEHLNQTLNKFGLSAFGEKGDPFDPKLHEAVAHMTSADVMQPTCIDVMRRGYLLGDRLLRPAMVAVADPSSESPEATSNTTNE